MHLRHMSQMHSWCAATTNKIYGCIRAASLGAVARGVPPSSPYELIVVPTISSACATSPMKLGITCACQQRANKHFCKRANAVNKQTTKLLNYSLSLYSRFT